MLGHFLWSRNRDRKHIQLVVQVSVCRSLTTSNSKLSQTYNSTSRFNPEIMKGCQAET